jgi:hypothetical protein
MPLPVYPSGIPYRPRRNDWSMPQPWTAPIETEMADNSNVRLRATPGSNVAIVQQIVRMLAADVVTFKAFVKGTLNFGTSRFTMTVWTGAAYETLTVQFVKGSPTYQNLDRYVQVGMQLRLFGSA